MTEKQYLLEDLTSFSVFKIGFFSILGFFIPLFLLISIFVFLNDFSTLETSRYFYVEWFIMMFANMIFGPLVFAIVMLFGWIVYLKLYTNRSSVVVEFFPLEQCYENLRSDIIYQLFVSCFRGLMSVFAGLFTLMISVFCLLSIIVGKYDEILGMLGFALVTGVMLVIMPYLYAISPFFGSFIGKYIARKIGGVNLEFSPEVAEQFSPNEQV